MDNILKAILIGSGVLITCVVVSIGFYVYRETKSIASENSKKLSELSSELSEHDLIMYEGLEITGSDVRNFIKKYLSEYTATERAPIYVNVITPQDNEIYINGLCIEDIQDFTKQVYINPNAKFKSEIIRDKNKVIVGLKYTQI